MSIRRLASLAGLCLLLSLVGPVWHPLGPWQEAMAGTLAAPDEVDLIELDASTAQLQLLVVLGDDRVDSKAAIKALYAKVNHYQHYIASGRALTDTPGANPQLRPAVVLLAPRDASTAEMQNLEGIKLNFAIRSGAEIVVRPHVPGLTPRPLKVGRAGCAADRVLQHA